jgi:hypothetical protein
MNRLILALAGTIALSACSNTRDRSLPPGESSASRPDLTLPDSSALAARGERPVSPVEQQVVRSPEKKTAAPTPAAPTRRKRPVRPATPPDTVARGYAPPVASKPAPVPDSSGSRRDTVASTPKDTVRKDTARVDTVASAPDTSGAKPDTAKTAAADTVRTGADTVRTASADTATALDTISTRASDTATASNTAGSTAGMSAAPSTAAARTLPVGSEIHAALDDSIDSRRDSVGSTVMASVSENVTGSDGKTLIPAGTPVRLTITRLTPAKSKGSQGALSLRVEGVALNGGLQPVKATVQPVSRELRGRGVTGSDAAKVGVGAAGGAVLGRVLGGSTKGAVIGGVVGAAGGAVVASQTATRDVVVKARTPVVLVLTAPLTTP